MMTLNDWKQEANRQLAIWAGENSEYFSFWLGFSSGLDNAKFVIKHMIEDAVREAVKEIFEK